MRRVLKWIGIVLGGLLSLLVIIVAVLAIFGGSKLNKQYDVQPEPVAILEETAVLERGEYLVSVSCAGCHGENLGGTAFFDDPVLGSIPAPNLTAGEGGLGATYSNADFVRAIRHGLDNEGKPLMVMPSAAFWHYSDDDLGAIIAYVQSVPPVDNSLGAKTLKPVGRILLGVGVLDVLSAENIDHTASRPAVPEHGVSALYGEYLINTNDCRVCHGADLAGGHSGEPGAPPGPDLVSVSAWSDEDFLNAMRIGVTPDGRHLNPAFMPWQEYGRMTDDDLAAIYLYLQAAPTAVSETE
jgi:mono/diheme cytochrome c family protein